MIVSQNHQSNHFGHLSWLKEKICAIAQQPDDQRIKEFENLIPHLAKLPILKYEETRTHIRKELGYRAEVIDQLVAEYKSKTQLNGNFTPLSSTDKFLNPALDFSGNIGILTISLPTVVDENVQYKFFLITSDRQVIRYENKAITIEVNDQKIVVKEKAMIPDKQVRWSWEHVQRYEEGETVNPLTVFQTIEAVLLRYVEWQDPIIPKTIALWIMGTYLYPLFDAYPYLNLLGPKGSGKTKAIEVVIRQSFNGRMTANITTPALFRIIEATGSTLGIDEAERLKNSRDPASYDLKLILYSGYRKGTPAVRCEGENFTPKEYETYSPKSIAGIQGVDDVLESRCIVVNMLRAKPSNPVGKQIVSDQAEDWGEIRHQLYVFALTHFEQIANNYHDQDILGTLNNRAAELWRPLLSIAKVIDPDTMIGLFDQIYEYALAYAKDAEVAEIDDEQAALIRVLIEITSTGTTEFQPKVVSDKLTGEIEDPSLSPYNPQWVGYKLKGFRLRSERKSRGTIYHCTHEQAIDLAERYGIDYLK